MSNLTALLNKYKALVIFDTETSGLDFDKDQIIELAALRVERTASGGLRIAHNAQFDACFLRGLLRGAKVGRIDWLDSLTVYKDRRPYPHKLANAILAYELEDKVQNSHRAIDDVLALFEVLKAMDDERDDLAAYVNLFGYNPKYGVSGRRIVGVRYEPQGFNKAMTRPEQTLPARAGRRKTT